MKKKRIIAGALATCLALPLVVGFSAGCGKPMDINAKDIYAMSALSSVEYLSNNSLSGAAASSTPDYSFATSRPASITDEDEKGIKGCLDLFGEFMSNGGVDQTTAKNTITEQDNAQLAAYNLVMTISLPNVTGFNSIQLYYTETNTKTTEEVDDEGIELEVSSTLEGVLVVGADTYVVSGRRTFEKEGNEEEATIEFWTYMTNGGVKDNDNFVYVSQSVEQGEVEYEYAVTKGGQEILEVELEYEVGRNSTSLTYEVEVEGTRTEKEYKIVKRNDENTFTVYVDINGDEQVVVVTPTADGYEFQYGSQA